MLSPTPRRARSLAGDVHRVSAGLFQHAAAGAVLRLDGCLLALGAQPGVAQGHAT